MKELWQLYDEQGRPLKHQGGSVTRVYGDGLLHGAAHVWIWRQAPHGAEVLLQKRAAAKRTWPNTFDISAAGHIDLGEAPLTAALRETKEEIGLSVSDADLTLIGVQREHLVAQDGSIENEFQWLYLLRLDTSQEFNLQTAEVDSLHWKPVTNFESETSKASDKYVPHGSIYYQTVVSAIKARSADSLSA